MNDKIELCEIKNCWICKLIQEGYECEKCNVKAQFHCKQSEARPFFCSQACADKYHIVQKDHVLVRAPYL